MLFWLSQKKIFLTHHIKIGLCVLSLIILVKTFLKTYSYVNYTIFESYGQITCFSPILFIYWLTSPCRLGINKNILKTYLKSVW